MLLPWTEAKPPQSAAVTADPQAHAAELLAAREQGPTPLLDDLRELCDGIGGRPTGSKACDRAVDWAVARFRAAGVESTWTETYTIPGSWVGGADHAECLAPAEFPIRVAAGPFTAPTPGGHGFGGAAGECRATGARNRLPASATKRAAPSPWCSRRK